MLEELIGKEVNIYLGAYSELTKPHRGIIESVKDGWLILKQKRNTQILNIQKISRLQIIE